MRRVEERSFRTFDGVELFYRHWPVEAGARKAGAIVLFHRGHEHSGRMMHLVDELGLSELEFFAWDARKTSTPRSGWFVRRGRRSSSTPGSAPRSRS